MCALGCSNKPLAVQGAVSNVSFLDVATRPAVIKRAAVMGLIVGNVIGALNHGDKIIMGLMTPTDWLKVGLTFLVPYTVSTVSSVLAIRDQEKLLMSLSASANEAGNDALKRQAPTKSAKG